MNMPKEGRKPGNRKLVGIRIRQLRESIPMTQQKFADELDVSRAAVCQWENGTTLPSLDKLWVMKEKFGISIDALLDETEPPKGAMVIVKGFASAIQALGGETDGGNDD